MLQDVDTVAAARGTEMARVTLLLIVALLAPWEGTSAIPASTFSGDVDGLESVTAYRQSTDEKEDGLLVKHRVLQSGDCAWTNDGVCDEPCTTGGGAIWLCDAGTDTADCNVAVPAACIDPRAGGQDRLEDELGDEIEKTLALRARAGYPLL